jgi:hypothetical protein
MGGVIQSTKILDCLLVILHIVMAYTTWNLGKHSVSFHADQQMGIMNKNGH